MEHNIDNFGYLLNKAARFMKWELSKRLEQHEVTASQWSVLKDLHLHEKDENAQSCTAAAIADRLNIDRPTMSGIISRLNKNGWIETAVNPEDKRSQLVKLTDKSRDILSVLEELSNEIVEQALRGFSQEEVEMFKSFLKRIINNL